MQPNRDNETAPAGTPEPPEVVRPEVAAANALPPGTQQTVVREDSGDPAVIITRTGPSYNTRVITAAVIALVLLLAVWLVLRQRHAPGSDVNAASGGDVVVDSTPIPQRAATGDTGAGGTGYWPQVPYATGQPAPTTVITPSPYTTTPEAYPPVAGYSTPVAPPPPMPNPAPLGPPPATMPRNAGTQPASSASSPTVFPHLDSILGVPVDSQGRARVVHPRDTVTHIDSVLRRNPATTPPPATPTKVDTIRPTTPPTGSTTRVDTSQTKGDGGV